MKTNVFKLMYELIYGATPVSIESRWPLSEALSRLSRITAKSFVFSLTKQSLVGTVSERRVRLHRAIPMIWNSAKPFFVGSFVEENGRATLKGVFTMQFSTKLLLTVWFLFVTFWTAISAIAYIQDRADWTFPAFGFALFVAGSALFLIGKWFVRNDVDWIVTEIRKALS